MYTSLIKHNIYGAWKLCSFSKYRVLDALHCKYFHARLFWIKVKRFTIVEKRVV